MAPAPSCSYPQLLTAAPTESSVSWDGPLRRAPVVFQGSEQPGSFSLHSGRTSSPRASKSPYFSQTLKANLDDGVFRKVYFITIRRGFASLLPSSTPFIGESTHRLKLWALESHEVSPGMQKQQQVLRLRANPGASDLETKTTFASRRNPPTPQLTAELTFPLTPDHVSRFGNGSYGKDEHGASGLLAGLRGRSA